MNYAEEQAQYWAKRSSREQLEDIANSICQHRGCRCEGCPLGDGEDCNPTAMTGRELAKLITDYIGGLYV